jgi:hypothetical protein
MDKYPKFTTRVTKKTTVDWLLKKCELDKRTPSWMINSCLEKVMELDAKKKK